MSEPEKIDLQKMVSKIKPVKEDAEKSKRLRIQQKQREFSEAIKKVLPSRLLEYKKYYPKTSADVEEKKHKFINGKSGLWLICGKSGSGKTCFASEIIAQILWKYPSAKCVYKLTSEFFIDLREAMQKKYEAEYLREMVKADLLVLDDFGANGYSEYERVTFQHIVTSKESWNKKLIVITNMSVKQSQELLRKLITQPSVRRINESFGFLEI